MSSSAMARSAPLNGNLDLWLIGLTVADGVLRGTNATRLCEATGYSIVSLRWSPLGDRIVFETSIEARASGG